jgi:hypothetical protein
MSTEAYGEQLLALLRTYLAASKTQPMAVASSPITLNGTDCRLAVMSEELFAVLTVAAEEANKVALAAAPSPHATLADSAAWEAQQPNGKSGLYEQQ